ncbi:MAG: 16S rRNA (guanine(527)-N(7))-methyltransferase RsmG [Lachnospiraceae bacterium]|nr:16S rRNA (guanine(527)-N(7))-methyltransferase RsmG [Lachnospiraceae bacterium]
MKELLYNTALETGINLTDIQLEKFQIYYNLLIETNKVMNLTSITEEKDVVLKHFIDSLAIKNYIDISNGRVIDIGTGAGFPGIPLAIIYNDTQFTLMDSLNKRINFINTVMEECKLYNIETVHSRAEDLGHNNVYREKYDYCVSRAVAAIPVLLEYCIPFLKTGGKFISYKSEKAEEEISLSGNAQKKLGCRFDKLYSFDLPGTDISRKFVVFEKIKTTNRAYPRQAGKPKRSSL